MNWNQNPTPKTKESAGEIIVWAIVLVTLTRSTMFGQFTQVQPNARALAIGDLRNVPISLGLLNENPAAISLDYDWEFGLGGGVFSANMFSNYLYQNYQNLGVKRLGLAHSITEAFTVGIGYTPPLFIGREKFSDLKIWEQPQLVSPTIALRVDKFAVGLGSQIIFGRQKFSTSVDEVLERYSGVSWKLGSFVKLPLSQNFSGGGDLTLGVTLVPGWWKHTRSTLYSETVTSREFTEIGIGGLIDYTRWRSGFDVNLLSKRNAVMQSFHLGGEYEVQIKNSTLPLRAGYYLELLQESATSSLSRAHNFTLGIGYVLDGTFIDVAYVYKKQTGTFEARQVIYRADANSVILSIRTVFKSLLQTAPIPSQPPTVVEPRTEAPTSRKLRTDLPAPLDISIKLDDPNLNQVLDALETATLVVEALNKGPGDAESVRVSVDIKRAVYGLIVQPLEMPVGNIFSKDSKTARFKIVCGKNLEDGEIVFNLVAKSHDGSSYGDKVASYKTSRRLLPKMDIEFAGIRKDEDDGLITTQSLMDVFFRIKNTGESRASKIRLSFKADPGVNVTDDSEPQKYYEAVPSTGEQEHRIKIWGKPDAGSIGFEARLEWEEMDEPRIVRKTFRVGERYPRYQPPSIGGYMTPRPLMKLENVDLEIPKGKTKNPEAFALLIGNKNYDDVHPVKYADNDSRVMKEYLLNRLGFDESNIYTLSDATLGNLKTWLGGKLYEVVHSRGIKNVFIYYSGHGYPDPLTRECYLVPKDGDISQVRKSCYSLEALYNDLAKLGTNQITVVIDACFSGRSAVGPLNPNVSATGFTPETPTLNADTAMVFNACGATEYANWLEDARHGLFTYCFLNGLRGAADGNRDSTITAEELKTYLKVEVPKLASQLNLNTQRPEIDIRIPNKVIVEY